MCEYCENNKELKVEYESAVCGDKGFVLEHRIRDNKIFICANLGFLNEKGNPDYRITLSKIKINYCPMCRKKVR